MKTLQKIILVASLLTLLPITIMGQSSKVIKENRNLSGFSDINISGGWNAVLTQGQNFSITVEANEESIDNLRIDVKDETLYVSSGRGFRFLDIFKSRSNNIRKVHITLPELQKITALGGSDILPQTHFNTENMKIVLSGGSDLKNLSLNCRSLDCRDRKSVV